MVQPNIPQNLPSQNEDISTNYPTNFEMFSSETAQKVKKKVVLTGMGRVLQWSPTSLPDPSS